MIESYTTVAVVYSDSIESAQYADALEKRVNALIGEGWQPFGALAATTRNGATIFVQPMVRYRDGAPTPAL